MVALRRLRPTRNPVTFPSLSFHCNLPNFLVGAPLRVGSLHPDSGPPLVAWRNTHCHPVAIGGHDVEQNPMLGRILGTPRVEFGDFEAAAEHCCFEQQDMVGFDTSCQRENPYKERDEERSTAVIERLLDEGVPFRMRMFFGPDERDQLRFFEERLASRGVEFVHDLGLLDVACKVGECSVFVSNDSGLILAVLAHYLSSLDL